jgi:L-ascorbate metabolism protein UlaG (beta-lactamase superfamily)
LRATWLGHSTVLLELDGIRVLTDPVWGSRASPVPLLGPKRFQPVPVSLEALPDVDLVLISHDHYDHLDVKTLRRIEAVHRPRYITGLGTGALLRRIGLTRVHELDWW